MEPFWMVYVEGKRAPAFKHPTLEEAEAEAVRLSIPGEDAYILQAVRVLTKTVNMWWESIPAVE
jgi:hypothetical protein